MTAKVICSWCNGLMADGELPASHGICGPCIVTIEAGERAVVSDVERTVEETQRGAHRQAAAG